MFTNIHEKIQEPSPMEEKLKTHDKCGHHEGMPYRSPRKKNTNLL